MRKIHINLLYIHPFLQEKSMKQHIEYFKLYILSVYPNLVV